MLDSDMERHAMLWKSKRMIKGSTLGEDAEKLEKLRLARLTLIFGNVLTEAEMEKTAKRINAKAIKALHP